MTPYEDGRLLEDFAEWYLTNIFDRTDGYAAWNKHAYKGKGGFFCNNKKTYTYDDVKRALIDHFTGRGPGMHAVIGSYFINPITQKTKSFALDIDAHFKEGESQESFEKKKKWAKEAAERVRQFSIATGIPLRLVRSRGGRGYNVWCLLKDCHNGGIAQAIGKRVAAECDLGDVEVFPKQDKVEEGSWGSQVAITASKHFNDKTGGSIEIDVQTGEEIPFGRDLLEYLRQVKANPLSVFRQRYPEVFVPKTAPRQASTPLTISADGLPELKTIDDIDALLRKHGIEGGTPKSGGGRWTDKILLKECPNAEAHGSNRGDGAAILFNNETKRVGFKCHHAGCEASKFSWPKLLKKLGYKVKFSGPDRGRWIYDEEKPKEPTKPARKKRPFRSVERVSREDKDRMLGFALANKDEPYINCARLAKRLRRVANCGSICQLLECADHGPQGTIVRPCDDSLFCTKCAARDADIKEEFIRREWSEHVYMIEKEVALGDRAAMQTAWKEMKAEVKRLRGPLPIFVEGADRIFFIWPSLHEGFATTRSMQAVKISREDAAKKVAAAFYAVHHYFLTHWLAGSLVDLLRFPWFKEFRRHRVGGGGEASRELPMTDVFRERKKKNAEWKKEHPGADRCKCCTVVGEEDGKPVYCHKDQMSTATYTPSGAVIGRKVGAFRDNDLTKAMNSTGVEFAYLESKGPAFTVG